VPRQTGQVLSFVPELSPLLRVLLIMMMIFPIFPLPFSLGLLEQRGQDMVFVSGAGVW